MFTRETNIIEEVNYTSLPNKNKQNLLSFYIHLLPSLPFGIVLASPRGAGQAPEVWVQVTPAGTVDEHAPWG